MKPHQTARHELLVAAPVVIIVAVQAEPARIVPAIANSMAASETTAGTTVAARVARRPASGVHRATHLRGTSARNGRLRFRASHLHCLLSFRCLEGLPGARHAVHPAARFTRRGFRRNGGTLWPCRRLLLNRAPSTRRHHRPRFLCLEGLLGSVHLGFATFLCGCLCRPCALERRSLPRPLLFESLPGTVCAVVRSDICLGIGFLRRLRSCPGPLQSGGLARFFFQKGLSGAIATNLVLCTDLLFMRRKCLPRSLRPCASC
mmetsp:Transcript_25636/g.74083  ORF Transcript_25636/g.74083 Transcript_25636/m.74083 type:complete len:261 (+) Transcript_25636:1386-2168(+)